MSRVTWISQKNPDAESSLELYEFYDEYCDTFDRVPFETYKRYCREAFRKLCIGDVEDRAKTTRNSEGMTVQMKASEIKTESDLIKFGKIDTDRWQCTKLVNEFWGNDDNPNYLIKGEYKPRSNGYLSPKEYAKRFNENIDKFTIPKFNEPKVNKTGHAYEICIFDHHFGQLSLESETGDIDYNLDVAYKMYMDAIKYFIAETKHDVERYILPVGNDFFNVDNALNTTAKGTIQIEDSTEKNTFLKAEKLLIEAITTLNEFAEVTVVVIPGNHDYNRIFYVGEFLKAYFRENKSIVVDNRPTGRKYIKYGVNLIGYTHGNQEVKGSLPLLMVQENPQAYADTKYHEWHIGHWHSAHDKSYRHAKEDSGIRVTIISSLVPLDDFHKGKGYRHINESVCYKWSENKGKICTHFYHPD